MTGASSGGHSVSRGVVYISFTRRKSRSSRAVLSSAHFCQSRCCKGAELSLRPGAPRRARPGLTQSAARKISRFAREGCASEAAHTYDSTPLDTPTTIFSAGASVCRGYAHSCTVASTDCKHVQRAPGLHGISSEVEERACLDCTCIEARLRAR